MLRKTKTLVDSRKFIYGVEISEQTTKKMGKQKKQKKTSKKMKKIWEQFCTHSGTILHENPHPESRKSTKFQKSKIRPDSASPRETVKFGPIFSP